MVLSMMKKLSGKRIRSAGVGAVIPIRVLRDGFTEKRFESRLKMK